MSLLATVMTSLQLFRHYFYIRLVLLFRLRFLGILSFFSCILSRFHKWPVLRDVRCDDISTCISFLQCRPILTLTSYLETMLQQITLNFLHFFKNTESLSAICSINLTLPVMHKDSSKICLFFNFEGHHSSLHHLYPHSP